MLDAHCHVWQLARGDYGWLAPSLGAIYRDINLSDWRAVSQPCGVTAAILVQAAPTAAETAFLLDAASRATDVLGVVGWVDFMAADACEQIAQLAQTHKLAGLRPMLQDIADPDWILQAAVQPALRAMAEHALVLDALILPQHIPRMAQVGARHPRLRIVIDHAAKPEIAQGELASWAIALTQLAANPQVTCKLSGLWTQVKGPGGAPVGVASMDDAVQVVLQAFGPSRLLWGSDWPVLELAGDYASWLDYARARVEQHLGSQALAAVFGGNAMTVYRLQRR